MPTHQNIVFIIYLLQSIAAEEDSFNPFSLVFSHTTPPILFSGKNCDDIADGLLGTRGAELSSVNIVKLHTTTSIPQSPGKPQCVVNSLYLDNFPAWPYNTMYDMFMFSETSKSLAGKIWDDNSISLSKNQQFAVISCDTNTNKSDPIPELGLETNFDFIFNMKKNMTLDILQCYAGFCLVRITSKTCFRPIFSQQAGVLPSSYRNMLRNMQTQISILTLGVESVFMSIQSISPENSAVEEIFRRGLKTSKESGFITTICINQKNMACTQKEANDYGLVIFKSLQSMNPETNDFIDFVSVTKNNTGDSVFLVNYMAYSYQFSVDNTLDLYMRKFRTCPQYTMTTGDNRFFYDDNMVFEIACAPCQINTYYSESRIMPTVTQTSKTMYIHNSYGRMGRGEKYHMYFTISSDNSPLKSSENLYAESIVEIGTSLLLQIPDEKKETQSIGVVECEGRPVQHTRVNSSLISIEITMAYSGKLIAVSITDTSLQNDPNLLSIPVYILPRHSEIIGTCIKCPPGTFAGSYRSVDASKCENTTHQPAANRRLLSFEETKQTSAPAVVYIQINGQVSILFGIQNNNANPGSDFSIDVILQQMNLTFVQDNIEIITQKILEIYNVDKHAIEYKVTGIILHQSNVAVILGIHGNYTDILGILGILGIHGNYTDILGIRGNYTDIVMQTETDEFSLFGFGVLYSILGLAGAGLVLVVVIVIIIVFTVKHHSAIPVHADETKNKLHPVTASKYCMVCQSEGLV